MRRSRRWSGSREMDFITTTGSYSTHPRAPHSRLELGCELVSSEEYMGEGM